MRNSITGDLQVYDISNNEVTGSAFLGNVGLEWQFVGVAPVIGETSSDLVLRNVNTGAFEVYNIADNQVTGFAPLGEAGVEWQLGSFAPIGSSVQQPRSVPTCHNRDFSLAYVCWGASGVFSQRDNFSRRF